VIPNDHAITVHRFGEQRWIDKVIAGELSFSCAGAFIHQAKKTGNYVQGDLHEAVFARLLKNDVRIAQMRALLGTDLEEIPDGDYVFLRRHSAKRKPIFCFYGYTAGDALDDGHIDHEGLNRIRHEFDEKMYSGFSQNIDVRNVVSDEYRFTELTVIAGALGDRVRAVMDMNGFSYKMGRIDYDIMNKDEFFIQPTSSYDELFYKHPAYKYQYEARICLFNMKLNTIFDRFALQIPPLTKDEYAKVYERTYMSFDAVIKKK